MQGAAYWPETFSIETIMKHDANFILYLNYINANFDLVGATEVSLALAVSDRGGSRSEPVAEQS